MSGDGHYNTCDLIRPHRRALLCLECVEARLGRRVVVADLLPCLGNYHAAVVERRLRDTLSRGVSERERSGAVGHGLGDLARLEALSSRTPRDQAVLIVDDLNDPDPKPSTEIWTREPFPLPPDAVVVTAGPYRIPECDHGVVFDKTLADRIPKLTTAQVRASWPRLDGPCPKGCGYSGIAYASRAHQVYGDW